MNFAFLLVLLLCLPVSGDTTLYHPDPNHLWNRLHRALWVRTGPDGKEYGSDRLDPLLGRVTNHLLTGPSHERAVAVLEEFLSTHGDSLIADPLQRAILQRDLWAVLGWVRGSVHSTIRGEPLRDVAGIAGGPLKGIAELQAAQARLQGLLAAAILRVASDTGQAAALPDNYAAAIQAGVYSSAFDPGAPDRPFLPPDLFDPKSSWVCLGRPDGPAALRHMQGQGFRIGNSVGAVWLAFLRLPGGRPKTLEYLEKISGLEVHTQVPSDQTINFLLSLSLPQFPESTQVALVRRLILIGADGRLVLTPLVLQVRLRVYRQIPSGRSAFRSYVLPEVRSWQSYLDFHLSRAALFAGQGGGLRWEEEEEWLGGYQLDDHDVFEATLEEFRNFVEGHRDLADRDAVRCAVCHSGPGIYSLNSFAGGLQGIPNNASGMFSAPHLYPISPEEASQVAVAWKEKQSEWRMLREVLLEEAKKR